MLNLTTKSMHKHLNGQGDFQRRNAFICFKSQDMQTASFLRYFQFHFFSFSLMFVFFLHYGNLSKFMQFVIWMMFQKSDKCFFGKDIVPSQVHTTEVLLELC